VVVAAWISAPDIRLVDTAAKLIRASARFSFGLIPDQREMKKEFGRQWQVKILFTFWPG